MTHVAYRRPQHAALIGITALLCIFAPLSLSAETSDYLIIKAPAALTLQDAYQRRVSDDKKKALPAGVPFRIEQLDETMGDELTHAHRVSYDGTVWYVVLDDDGTPRGAGDAGISREKRCAVLDDSIQVKRSSALTVKTAGSTRPLYQDDIVYRYFSRNGRYYLRKQGTDAAGWSTLKPRGAWGTVQAPERTVSRELGERTRDRIKDRINAANAAYKEYTAFFNRRTGDVKSPPRWDLKPDGTGFTCAFSGTADELAVLGRSTDILVGDLANMVLGKPYRVLLKKRKILIEKQN